MNVIFPIAGPKLVFTDSLGNSSCKPLIDIIGKPLIERIFINVSTSLPGKNNYIFVVNDSDCTNFSLDSVLSLLSPNAHIDRLKGQTQGSLCSCLVAMGHINPDEELLVVNGDQHVDYSLEKIISYFRERKVDGGVVTFDSIHPKWSYVRLNADGVVVETSEKRPLSRNASVGIYYFRKASDFIESAKGVIRKDANVNGAYYVSSVYNEMILRSLLVLPYKIPNASFFPLDTPETIDAFVKYIQRQKND